MAYEYRAERTIEFAETDMAGIVHFSNYFRFMEATEHYFFRSLGLHLDFGSGVIGNQAARENRGDYAFRTTRKLG